MKLDLVEIRSNNYKKKIIIIVVIAIVAIVVFSILGIKVAESYNKRLIEKSKISQQIEQSQEIEENSKEIVENTNNDKQETETVNMQIPVYSENAKKKMKNIYSSSEKIAYLTFDDGPSQTVTPQILDVLKQENIKATFFVLGMRVKANPELVKREYEEGHYIANHGYYHDYASIYKSVNNVIKEYNKNEKEIQNAIGVEEYQSHLFRFPGGSIGGKYADLKSKAKKELNKQNISYIDWNALTNDAAGANTKKKILSNLKSTVKGKNSVVILMHDASNKILTYETLPDVIQYLREQGYSFDNFYSIMK